MLLKIFKGCENLKELKFTDDGIEFDNNIEREKPHLKLKLLEVSNHSRIYDLLINSDIKSFSLSCTGSSDGNQSLENFLMNKKIQNLTLTVPSSSTALNGWILWSIIYTKIKIKINVKLKKLELESLTGFNPEDLKLLNQDKNFFEHVVVQEVIRTESLNTLSNFKNLKFLELTFNYRIADSHNFQGLPQVEHLVIDAKMSSLEFFVGKFPNLKSLDIKNHQRFSIFQCYKLLIDIVIGNRDLMIQKATIGMNDFKSCNSKFLIQRGNGLQIPVANIEQFDDLSVYAELRRINYGVKEIKNGRNFHIQY